MKTKRSLRTLLALLAAMAMVATFAIGCDDDDGDDPTGDMTGDATMTGDMTTSTTPDMTTSTTPDMTTTTDPDVTSPDATDPDTTDPDTVDPDMMMGNTIVDVAAADGNFTTLLAAATEAGLADDLMGDGPFTVFAPTDDAFAQFLTDNGLTAQDLLDDPRLETILSYHVVPQSLDAAAVSAETKIPSLIDVNLYIDASDGVDINLGDATVVTPDVMADNGIIHVIDGVLMPPTIPRVAELEGGFGTLLTAAGTAEVDTEGTTVADVLGDDSMEYTVLAPTDDAFTAFLTDAGIDANTLLMDEALTQILTYHAFSGVVDAAAVTSTDKAATLTGINVYIDNSGASPVLNGAVNVTVTDVPAVNGLIHVIDYVLIPPTIPEVAAFEGGFDTLLTAAGTAEVSTDVTVADALSATDVEYTLLAPTDAAFDALLMDAGITINDLLADPGLTRTLLYHALPVAADAATVVTLDKAPSLTGTAVYIDASGAAPVLNGSVNVTVTDVFASNGVIHVVDAVLVEPNLAEVATLEGLGTLVAAAGAAGIDSALVADGADLTVFAPTEQAFADALMALGVTEMELLADPDLANILLYHVVDGTTLAEDVVTLDGVAVPTLLTQDPSPLMMMNGDEYQSPVIVTVDANGGVLVNASGVTETDILAANGVIHTIDAVLLPNDAVEVAQATPDLSDLVTVATTVSFQGSTLAELVSAPDGPYTIFAPNNAAWQALYADTNNGIASAADVPASAVLFHVVPGFNTALDVVAAAGTGLTTVEGSTLDVAVAGDGTVTVGNTATAVVQTINVPSANAVIHIIDGVVAP